LWLGGLLRPKEVGRSPKKPSSLLVLVRPRRAAPLSFLSAMIFSCAAARCSLAISCARWISAAPGGRLRLHRINRSRSGKAGS